MPTITDWIFVAITLAHVFATFLLYDEFFRITLFNRDIDL